VGKKKAERALERNPGADAARGFDKELGLLSHRHQRWRVFSDFCEMGALAVSFPRSDEKEARYAKIASAYTDEERQAFPRMFAHVVEALEDAEETGQPVDFLGSAFQRNELANHWHGQFFTPISVAQMMAMMLVGDGEDLKAKIEEQGFVSVNEPACGAGAMLLAFAAALRAAGINYQERCLAVAQDLDPTAAHMATIQLSLIGLPAVIVVGNTISMEVRETFWTPLYWLFNWRFRRKVESAPVLVEPAPADTATSPAPGQLSLF
jgi:hypothetical protein